jgi:hypothetical protein
VIAIVSTIAAVVTFAATGRLIYGRVSGGTATRAATSHVGPVVFWGAVVLLCIFGVRLLMVGVHAASGKDPTIKRYHHKR